MPRVRAVTVAPNALTAFTLLHADKTITLLVNAIPGSANTIQLVEDWINAWLVANATEYQAVVHVTGILPLVLTVGTFNWGIAIPATWWL